MKLLIVVVAAACAKTPEVECPDLRVTVDGAPLPAMPHGLAFSSKVNGQVTWYVDVSDVEVSCDQVPPNTGRTLRAGETSASASVGFSKTVGIANMMVTNDHVHMLGAPPSKPGDKLALCVDDASFKGDFDLYAGKTIVVNGELDGTYCGEKH